MIELISNPQTVTVLFNNYLKLLLEAEPHLSTEQKKSIGKEIEKTLAALQ